VKGADAGDPKAGHASVALLEGKRTSHTFRDLLLLALWVYSYQLLLRIFGLVKQIESPATPANSRN
jgi:hypothetical protein